MCNAGLSPMSRRLKNVYLFECLQTLVGEAFRFPRDGRPVPCIRYDRFSEVGCAG